MGASFRWRRARAAEIDVRTVLLSALQSVARVCERISEAAARSWTAARCSCPLTVPWGESGGGDAVSAGKGAADGVAADGLRRAVHAGG